jgi:hypothetical protein
MPSPVSCPSHTSPVQNESESPVCCWFVPLRAERNESDRKGPNHEQRGNVYRTAFVLFVFGVNCESYILPYTHRGALRKKMKKPGILPKTIISLCDGGGSWSQPYVDAGYNVQRVDLTQGYDVRRYKMPKGKVHGVLAAPPCTEFALSGARWWFEKGHEPLMEGLSVVDACLRLVLMCEPEWWCLENPVGRLYRWIGKPAMYFQPCDYGDPYTKKTGLWGKFNKPVTCPVEPIEGSKMNKLAPGGDRQRLRSETPPGFARAFFEANP